MTAAGWPPPVDETTVWRQFTPRDSQDLVRARQVRLWGQPVWAAEIGGEWRVWCPACRSFLELAALSRPYSGHSVGLQVPEGTIVAAEVGNDGPPSRRPGFIDLMRVPW